MNARNIVLGGQRPHAGNATQLQAVDVALRTVSSYFLCLTLSYMLCNNNLPRCDQIVHQFKVTCSLVTLACFS
jgi:hypothetical protein